MRNWIILLLVVAGVIVGAYYFSSKNTLTTHKLPVNTQAQMQTDDLQKDANSGRVEEVKESEVDPETILKDTDELEQNEEEVDQMIDELEELKFD